MNHSYKAFIESKARRFRGNAIEYAQKNNVLFPFQRDLVAIALERGRSALFADTGLGKTICELEWGTNVPGRVLLLAPLAVAHQIEREANRFGYDARVSGGGSEPPPLTKITLSNYEKLHRFNPDDFDAIILDESSCIKSYTGKIRTRLIEAFHKHYYKLAATATPSPNDFMELGNHAEFLGVMTRAEMLSMFFVHDGGSVQDWRLKGHAVQDFWQWVGSWASMIRAPSDLGYSNEGFDLPPLHIHHEEVSADFNHSALFPGAVSLDLNERRRARRASLSERVQRATELTYACCENGTLPAWLYWCDLNDESTAIAKSIPETVEVRGSDHEDHKRSALLGFADGTIRRLVTKSRIAGWGMNWQQCHRMAFIGLSDSFESWYQSIRRCWRFGQTEPVDVHLIYSEHEATVVANVLRKERLHREMQDALIKEINR